MTREKYIRLCGWGMVLAAFALLLTFLPEADKILDTFYQSFDIPATSGRLDLNLRLFKGVRSLPFPLAILLVTFGLSGLYICYGKQAGSSAKIALGIGILGGAAGLVSIVWMAPGIDNGRSVMNGFMAFMFAGLFVFGLVALRVKPMSRGNVLPVLAGFWWPLIVIQAYVFPLVTGRSGPQVPSWLSFAIFSLMSFFLALLGLVLQADARNRSASSVKMFF